MWRQNKNNIKNKNKTKFRVCCATMRRDPKTIISSSEVSFIMFFSMHKIRFKLYPIILFCLAIIKCFLFCFILLNIYIRLRFYYCFSSKYIVSNFFFQIYTFIFIDSSTLQKFFFLIIYNICSILKDFVEEF